PPSSHNASAPNLPPAAAAAAAAAACADSPPPLSYALPAALIPAASIGAKGKSWCGSWPPPPRVPPPGNSWGRRGPLAPAVRSAHSAITDRFRRGAYLVPFAGPLFFLALRVH
ncbi:unnamed protein product, partial [Ectocarpus sp. 12 AP-2014]